MASTTLTAKPQAPKPQQTNSLYQQEALPNVKPDFTIQMPVRMTASQRPQPIPQSYPRMTSQVNYAQTRQQNPPQMMSQPNYSQTRPNPQPIQQPIQQQGIDEMFGSTQTLKPVPAPPPKAQPAPINSKFTSKI